MAIKALEWLAFATERHVFRLKKGGDKLVPILFEIEDPKRSGNRNNGENDAS